MKPVKISYIDLEHIHRLFEEEGEDILFVRDLDSGDLSLIIKVTEQNGYFSNYSIVEKGPFEKLSFKKDFSTYYDVYIPTGPGLSIIVFDGISPFEPPQVERITIDETRWSAKKEFIDEKILYKLQEGKK